MLFHGPLPARNFLRLLNRMAAGPPDRLAVQETLDGLIEAAGAERGFLFRIRGGGGFRVLLARNRDREPIPRPAGKISHFAVRRALEEGGPHLVADARRDRRYRTEEGVRSRRQPLSLLVLPLKFRGEAQGGVYLDHRFRSPWGSKAALEAVEPWRALLAIGLLARERERMITTRGRSHPPDGAGGAPEPAARGVVGVPERVEDFHGLLAASPDMLDLIELARRLGPAELPLVVLGETGTGKELLARALHLSSRRAERPFLAVTCGGIPDALLESELFGHARGAFTGAEQEKRGLLLEADGGTLLLDEVGDMSIQMQQKLLRVLEDGRVRPLGQAAAERIDVRIISATHRDLEKLVAEGRFRKDLFYRLRGAVLTLPPLRERREEVLVLAAHFLKRFAPAGREGLIQLGESARRRLSAHGWPGNVRELENEMRRLAELGSERIEEGQLSSFIAGGRGRPQLVSAISGGLKIAQVVSDAEKEAIRKALARASGNKSRAALFLGITRKALYRRMARYGMIGSPPARDASGG